MNQIEKLYNQLVIYDSTSHEVLSPTKNHMRKILPTKNDGIYSRYSFLFNIKNKGCSENKGLLFKYTTQFSLKARVKK